MSKAVVLSGKNTFSTVGSSYNELWGEHGILFDIITVQKWLEKIRKLSFLNSVYYSYTVFAFQPIPIGYRFKIFI